MLDTFTLQRKEPGAAANQALWTGPGINWIARNTAYKRSETLKEHL